MAETVAKVLHEADTSGTGPDRGNLVLARASVEPRNLVRQIVGESKQRGVGVGAHSVMFWRVPAAVGLVATLVLLVSKFPRACIRNDTCLGGNKKADIAGLM